VRPDFPWGRYLLWRYDLQDGREMRVLGIDVGQRRIGLAVSDVSGTLARPLTTLVVLAGAGASEAVNLVMAEIARLGEEDDPVGKIVVGMPAHLDGTASREGQRVAAFIRKLSERTTIPVVTEGERLTSREAESRLAVTERDWRKRKAQLDAAAAAVILQDYLDQQQPH
jgi:putative holliday junction resolvase